MSRDTSVVAFRQLEAIDDPLSELAREGARRMLAQVLIAEADSFVAMWKDLKLPDGRDRIVRHGHGPHLAIQTGVGPVEVRRAKVRDRGDVGAEEKIRFTSFLPKWARRTKSLDALLPVLYLRGVSTGDFQEVLTALLGKDAPNLSPAVITRLTAQWQTDYDAWHKRDLSAWRYVKAVACLTKDREALLAFFDFPAEHWDHLRTSNPIESVFATVRHRTVRTKGALSAKTAKLMVFKLVNAAAKTWRRLKGENQLPKVVQGVKFQNGIEIIKMPVHHAA
jgi:transposase-like protein